MSYITKKNLADETKIQEAFRVSRDIASALRSSGHIGYSVALAAYLLHKASLFNNPLEISYQDILNGYLDITEQVSLAAKEYLSEQEWDNLKSLFTKYSPEGFALAAFCFEPSSMENGLMTSTPDSIVKLAQCLLNIKPEDDVVDLCCGVGSFLSKTALDVPDAHYSGYEINANCKVIADIRAELAGEKIPIAIRDVFSLAKDIESPKFDKVFSNYPFGMKQRNLGYGTDYLDRLSKKYPGVSRATSSDWVFNSLICDCLKEDGKAVAVMTNGSTWNSIDSTARKHFIEQGLVEAVIALPGKMFEWTSIPTTMILFSHGNHTVRLVDATGLCQQGRRSNEFSDKNIQEIITALETDSDISREISAGDLQENEYSLNLSRYLGSELKIEHAVPFDTVIKSITRGAPCTARQLDDMISNHATNMQYLMLANIQDGMIDETLPYLSTIPQKYERYCLKDNDLILSKNGYPYKIAIASIKNGQKILANGNLYIIEVDEEKVDPYYLKAFFESEQGIATLKSITVGATIPNIGVDKLKKVLVPIPPLAEQKRIVDKYRATLDEISILKLKLRKATSRLHHIFDEEREG